MIHEISSWNGWDCSSYGYTDDFVLDEDYAIVDGACQGDKHGGYRHYTAITDGDDDHNGDEDLLDDDLNGSSAKTPEILIPEENHGEINEEKNRVDVPDPVEVSGFSKNIWVFSSFLLRVVVMILVFSQLHGMKNHENIVPKFEVESVSVFPIEHDPVSGTIRANWNVIFNLKLPSDKQQLEYYGVTAEVLFRENKNPALFPGLNKFILPWRSSANSNVLWKRPLLDFAPSDGDQGLVKVTFYPSPISIDNDTATALVNDVKSGVSRGFSVRLSGRIHHSGRKNLPASFTTVCPLNMAFLDRGGVMASPSEECKFSYGESKSWAKSSMPSIVACLVLLMANAIISSKYVWIGGRNLPVQP